MINSLKIFLNDIINMHDLFYNFQYVSPITR